MYHIAISHQISCYMPMYLPTYNNKTNSIVILMTQIQTCYLQRHQTKTLQHKQHKLFSPLGITVSFNDGRTTVH